MINYEYLRCELVISTIFGWEMPNSSIRLSIF